MDTKKVKTTTCIEIGYVNEGLATVKRALCSSWEKHQKKGNYQRKCPQQDPVDFQGKITAENFETRFEATRGFWAEQ